MMNDGYKIVLASFVGEREGMAVELHRETGGEVAEVYEDDATKARTVTFFTDEAVPLDEVERLLAAARERL